MAYGANAKRVPASGKKSLADVDVFKLVMLGRTERGINTVHKNIYGFNDFREKCGNVFSSGYAGYIAKSFFETLKSGVNVEMRVKGFVASDAVQASGEIDDGATPAVKAFDIKAGYKGLIDKSAFGNKIGYKVSQSFNKEYKLSEDSTASASTTFTLTSVEHLRIGMLFKVVDTGTAKEEWAFITDKNEANKTVSFAALSNASAYEAATTTLYRADWNLEIGIKDENGVFQSKEKWLEYPMVKADTDGMPKDINDSVTGSKYVTLNWNVSNASDPDEVLPVAVTSFTALTSGADGTSPTDSDWNTEKSNIEDEDVMIMLAPESTSFTHNNNMAAFATDDSKFMYFGQAANEAGESTLRELGLSLRSSIRFAQIVMDKWMEVDDPLQTGSKKSIPPVGHAAAHWFNMYSIYGIGRVAAGNRDVVNTTDRLIDTNELVHDDKDGKGDRLIRLNSINIAKFQKGKGITINSARTLSTDPGYIFQNQVMGFLLIKKSILNYLREIEQDSGGIDAQQSHYNDVFAYLKKKYDKNVFFKGQKEDGTPTKMNDVVKIANDFSINSLTDIANGKETVLVETIFAPPIEEPTLELASASVTIISS